MDEIHYGAEWSLAQSGWFFFRVRRWESLLPALEQFKQFLEALISGPSGGHQVKVRLTIERFARFQNLFEFAHGFAAARHGP
jgi:hypothetical protein